MSTRQQRAAIRRNAERSANPCVSQAKPAAGGNAPKHGIIANRQVMFDETAEDLAELDAEVRDQYNPANPTQRALVDTLIHNEWRLRRMRRVEAELWQHGVNAYLTEHPEEQACNAADAFAAQAGPFERLQRIVNSCERNYHRALKELQRSQIKVGQVGQTVSSATPSQPQESKPSSPNLASLRRNPNPPTPAPPPAPQKAPAVVPEMDDETFRLRKAAIFADSMAKYGRK